MKHPCKACTMEKVPLGSGFHICPRCDTVAEGNGIRVGPPHAPGTLFGRFKASFGDRT